KDPQRLRRIELERLRIVRRHEIPLASKGKLPPAVAILREVSETRCSRLRGRPAVAAHQEFNVPCAFAGLVNKISAGRSGRAKARPERSRSLAAPTAIP